VERDPFDHQAGQVEADALVGRECHLPSEFGAWCRETQVLPTMGTLMQPILWMLPCIVAAAGS
jgi:hypothetical protein